MRDEATPDTVCVWQGWCCVLCVESPPPTNKKVQQITQTGRSCVSHVDRSVLVLGYEKGYLKGGGGHNGGKGNAAGSCLPLSPHGSERQITAPTLLPSGSKWEPVTPPPPLSAPSERDPPYHNEKKTKTGKQTHANQRKKKPGESVKRDNAKQRWKTRARICGRWGML